MNGSAGLSRGPEHLRQVLNRRHLLAGLSGIVIGGGREANLVLAQTPSESAQGHLPPRPATPNVSGPPALMDLHACVPESMMDEDYAAEYPWCFADIEQQFRSRGLQQGLEPGDAPPDGYLEAMYPVATQNAAFDHVLDQNFTAAIWFQPLNVHSSLVVGGPEGHLTLVRGGMDVAAMPSAWEASGYERTATADGHDVWTMGGELDFDVVHPIQGRVLASFNNAAIL